MNTKIFEIAKTVGLGSERWTTTDQFNTFLEKFAEAIKQEIYNTVKEELIEDSIINEEPDRVSREYLKGCNGGIVDALCHIKNFGTEIET